MTQDILTAFAHMCPDLSAFGLENVEAEIQSRNKIKVLFISILMIRMCYSLQFQCEYHRETLLLHLFLTLCHMHHIANVSGHVLYDSCEHNKYNASWDLQFNSIYSQIDKMKTIIKPYQIKKNKNKMLLFHSSNSYYIYQFNCSFWYIYTA